MNYYKMRSIIARRLRDYILQVNKNEPVDDWITFCRSIRLEFGISPSVLTKQLQEDYPNLSIEEGRLVRIVNGTD